MKIHDIISNFKLRDFELEEISLIGFPTLIGLYFIYDSKNPITTAVIEIPKKQSIEVMVSFENE